MRIGRGFGNQCKDHGTNCEIFGVLNCKGLSEFNFHSAVSSCVAIYLLLRCHFIALVSLRALVPLLALVSVLC